jgi:hypothetical protein
MFLEKIAIEVLLEKVQACPNWYIDASDGRVRTCWTSHSGATDVVWANDERWGRIPQKESEVGMPSSSSDSLQLLGCSSACEESRDEASLVQTRRYNPTNQRLKKLLQWIQPISMN